MKLITPTLFALALAAPAMAQTTPAPTTEKVAYICYYNEAGKLVSAKPAEDKEVPGHFQTTGRGGDEAWTYGIKSVDGSNCPKYVRN